MHKIGHKIAIWGVAITALVATCFLPYLTFAAGVGTETITIPSTANQLKEAAEIQLIVNTFQKCVGDLSSVNLDRSQEKDLLTGISVSGNMFEFTGDNNKPAGAWLEYQIQGKVDDGEIWCRNQDNSKIATLFASKLGLSMDQLICNVYSGSGYETGQRGGLFKRVVKVKEVDSIRGEMGDRKTFYQWATVNQCSGGIGSSDAHYVPTSDGWNTDIDDSGTAEYLGGVSYVKFLYNEYRNSHIEENPYLASWDELGNYTNPAMGYYLYLNDFYTACGSTVVDPTTTDNDKKWPAISIIDENYGITEVTYGRRSDRTSNWGTSFVSRKSGAHTCPDVAQKINEFADGARSELITQKQMRCNSESFDIAQKNWEEAQEILNDPEMDEDSKAKAQEVVDQINAYDGEFWTFNENGGIVCQPIPSVTGATTIVDEEDPIGPGDSGGDSSGEVGVLDGCFNSSGALGWIICPVLKIIGEAVNGIYGNVEDNYLSLKSNILQTSQLADAWNTFQTFANVIFVILLLVVIISQVTGLGISNYGVKKILPRLVITAVLVNLSLIICMIAADLSNIVGAGFNETLRNIKVDTLEWGDLNAGTFVLDTLTGMATVGTPLILGGITLGFTIADGGWAALIIPILISAIVAFFAIIFFYVLLAVRKAAIILLIAVSPIAIVCYALPNTQKVFSRWLKMFSSLLLVYPICGLLMGGGNFASRLLLVTAGEAGFIYYLVCMLLSFVPFFFIPTLLKNSMSALGSIGGKIAGLQSKWTNKATGAVRGSRWAQDHQQRIARNIDKSRNERLQNRWKSRYNELKKMRDEQGDQFSNRNQRQLKRAEYEVARVKSRFEHAAKEEEQAAVIANQEDFTEGSLRRTAFRDALEDKAQEERIGNLRSAAYHGHLDYTDDQGNKHVVDVKNIGGITADGKLMEYEMEDDGLTFKRDSRGRRIPIKGAANSLSAAFLNYNRAYDRAMADYDAATTTEDKDAAMARAQDAKIKAQAIATELLDAGGDNGQTAVGRALKSIKFDGAGNPLDRNITQSVDEISKFITRNGKWMAQIKKTDNGMFRLLNDAANEAATFKTRMNYATGGDLKITAEAVPDLSDGYLGGVTYEIAKGSYDNDEKAASRLLELDAAVQRAMSDPRIANRIKSETMPFLQKIHQKAYEIQQKRWLEAKDDTGNLINISQLSGYDPSTNMEVQANGVNPQDQLTYNGRVLLDTIGGTALNKNVAYAKQIRQATELVRGKVQDGEIKIPRKKALPDGWKWESKQGWYREEDATLPNGMPVKRIVKLSPEEVKRAELISEHNAKVDLMTEEINNTNNNS